MDEKRNLHWLRSNTTRKKSHGQSIVEFALLLPILVMMLSGLIEFGFMLNYYLDLIDGARELARFGANVDPLAGTKADSCDSDWFYELMPCMADQIFSEQVELDYGPGFDDLVLSAIGVKDGEVTERYPDDDGWSRNAANPRVSNFTNEEINLMLDEDAPATGMVLVEVFYDYHMILGLPWITMFVPDTITLHAYSIMPNTYVEPTPIP